MTYKADHKQGRPFLTEVIQMEEAAGFGRRLRVKWLETKVCSDKEAIKESSAAKTVAAAMLASVEAWSPESTLEGPEMKSDNKST